MQLPQQLLNSLHEVKNFDENAFVQSHHNLPNVSIRINPLKDFYNSSNLEQIAWTKNGYYLTSRPEFVFDPLWHSGAYYVQEASSMFLEQVFLQQLNTNENLKILDLCAAPGGKSTHIASLISENSLLISNEVIGSRANILVENVCKWGQTNTWVTNNDPKQFSPVQNFFDALIIDAPCSGSGLFRKDENAINEWSENNVNLCAERQKRILHDTINCLKPNGILVYMTCSYSEKENEEICDYILDNFETESIKLNLDDNWNITETISKKNSALAYRFFPHLTKGEGFFLACFKKKDAYSKEEKIKQNAKNEIKTNSELKNWVNDNIDLSFLENDKNIFAMNPSHLSYYTYLKTRLKIIKKGTHVGELNFKNFVPSHELSMSSIFNPNIEFIDLDLQNALKYLSRQEFETNANNKGWFFLRYEGNNLGWIKHLGNRINNYYPTNWRIRKQID